MSLKRASWKDSDGRIKVVLIPEDAGEEQAEMGIPLGPPSLLGLNLPEEIEIRLNNELANRGILTANEALRNRQEIMSAIQSALKLDIDRVIGMYVGSDFSNAKPAREPVVATSRPPVQQQRRRR